MATIPLPLVYPVGSRDGTVANGVPTKDAFLSNMMTETDPVYGKVSVKRPGISASGPNTPSGLGQGVGMFKEVLYEVRDDTLYALNASGNGQAAGTGTWTGFPGSGAKLQPSRTKEGFIVFNDMMFVIAGHHETAPARYLSDVWSSSDGEKWVLNTSAAPFGARGGMGVCVLNGVLYVIGGKNATTWFNDVWSTVDGTNWTAVILDAPWARRSLHACIAHNNGIYLFGGSSDTLAPPYQCTDCWFSPDGFSWTLVTDNMGWGLSQFGSAVFQRDGTIIPALWVWGGWDFTNHNSNAYVSVNGRDWLTITTSGLPATGISQVGCVVYGGKAWLIGGGGPASSVYATIRSSVDGIAWTTVEAAAFGAGIARYECAAVVYKNPLTYRYPTMWLAPGLAYSGGSSFEEELAISAPMNQALSLSTALNPDIDNQWYQFDSLTGGDYFLLKNTSNIWAISGNSVARIVDPNYPRRTVPGLVVLDQYAFVMDAYGVISNSNLENPMQWSSLDYIQAIYEDDSGVAIAKYINYIVAFKTKSLEFFSDAGNPLGSPLSVIMSATVRVGCPAGDTVVNIENTLMFIGQIEGEGNSVMILNGMVPTKVSNPQINRLIDNNQYSGGAAFAFSVNVSGHVFYVLTLVNIGVTLTYDIGEKDWEFWTSTANGSEGEFAWGMVVYGVNGEAFLQPRNGGGPFGRFTSSIYQDLGNQINCQMVTPALDLGKAGRKFITRLSLLCDDNQSTVTEQHSDDDYSTFSSARSIPTTPSRRSIWRLGSFFRRAFKFSFTDNKPLRVFRVDLDIPGGGNK